MKTKTKLKIAWSLPAIGLIMLNIIWFVIFNGCSHTPVKQSQEIVLKFESETPITVDVYKSCEGNWNFCQYK